jgi:branched-chain amino acid aminotransferase
MDTLTYIDGNWIEGNPPLFNARTHAAWLASVVFDGARAFEGVAPDLDLHCARLIRSAHAFGLNPPLSADAVLALAREGIDRFPPGSELYIRPMLWAEGGWVAPDPDSTRFAIVIFQSPLPPSTGLSACLSSRRRPAPDMAPTDAKAACLYPNAGRALREAAGRGLDTAVLRDPIGNVAEFATSNLFIVKDGVAHTPVPNGTFLAGITRQRVIGLLRDDGLTVEERTITVPELAEADEMFSTGNAGKVQPVIRYEDRDMQPGPVSARARELYWEFARNHG